MCVNVPGVAESFCQTLSTTLTVNFLSGFIAYSYFISTSLFDVIKDIKLELGILPPIYWRAFAEPAPVIVAFTTLYPGITYGIV